MPHRAFHVLIASALTCVIGVACSGPNELSSVSPTSRTEHAAATTTPPSSAVENTSAAITNTQPTAQPIETLEETNVSSDDGRAGCRRLTGFEDVEANRQWVVVNDDVMGGQSLGGLSFDDGILVFEGEINTDGGGFSSLRLPLEPEVLVPYDRIEFRARPDARTYMVTFDDALASRDRRVSHRAPIEFEVAADWQTVSVAFADLFPAIFGRPIDDPQFRKDLATRMGLMISDGLDGPFRLEIDWIDICPA